MGRFIPQYQPLQPLKSPFESKVPNQLFGAIMEQKEQRQEQSRLRNKAIQTTFSKLELPNVINDQNNQLAEQAYNSIVEDLTNSMMYEMDDDGTFTTKRKESSFWGPEVSDREYNTILQKIGNYNKLISQVRSEEEQIKPQWDMYQKARTSPASSNVDVEKTAALFDEYRRSGAVPEDGIFVVSKGNNPYVVFGDERYNKAKETWNEGRGLYVKPDIPIQQKQFTYDFLMEDPNNVKGVAKEMLSPNNLPEARNYIAASLGGGENSLAEADELIRSFYQTGKVPSVMKDAVYQWGDEVGGFVDMIGRGYEKKPRPRAGAEDDAPVDYTARTYEAGGVKLADFVDLGGKGRSITTKLPAGSMSVVSRDGKQETNKQFDNTSRKYRVVGYDDRFGGTGYIVLESKPSDRDMTDEDWAITRLGKDDEKYKTKQQILSEKPTEFLVPLRGNEALLGGLYKKGSTTGKALLD